MKRILLSFFALLLGGAAFAQGPSITVINNTGHTIEYLYVSSNASDDWEDDVLGRRVLEEGKEFKLSLPENGTYDFRAVDKDDDTYFKWNVVVRGNLTITFTADDYEEENGGLDASQQPYTTTSAPSGQTWVTISNQTGYEIYYLYVSPGDADGWGKDILGEDTFADGKELRVVLPTGPGPFDFRARDEDDDEYTQYDVEMSTGGANRVTLRVSDLEE
jgi:hypothetical protein